MEITRSIQSGVVDLAITGRLDSYWADHLDTAIAEVVREGHDRVQLDLSETTYLSSAGVAVLMKHYKRLVRLNGSLQVAKASEAVRMVLDMSRLSAILFEQAATPTAPAAAIENRSLEKGSARFDIVELDPSGTLEYRTIGTPASLAAPAGQRGYDVICTNSMFMLGIGAIGQTFEDCRDRFGDLLAVSGAVVYQPADGSNVPDYLVAERGDGKPDLSSPAPDARMLYGLACEGAFASLARFESNGSAAAVDLASVAEACLEMCGSPSAGVIIVAEVAGLVGAALRQSPFTSAHPARDARSGQAGNGGGTAASRYFAHPHVRERLTFTAERAFARNVSLVAGVVARPDAAIDKSQLRPIGGTSSLLGHFHAAAFPFVPLKKGRIELHDTVIALFESERVLGVLHLLHDDRAASGAGANEFVRGACWASPIRNEA
jgi:anti-anti-sigma factor